ncbi:MAG: glycosyltransferase family 4 protein [Planctomycetes bacterium]|nr:glycosyltransferase family 4 protein [Planctomycetota bacterium]
MERAAALPLVPPLGLCYALAMTRAELTPRPLSIWLVNPFDDVPGEGLPPLRYWTLARVLAGRGHDVTWWTAAWSHRRKASRVVATAIAADEGFSIRAVAVRPYRRNVSLARLWSHRDFGRQITRIAAEEMAAGHLERPDVILASLPPLEGPEAALDLGKRLDAHVVVDLMDLWPETFERLLPGPEWLVRWIAPIVLGAMRKRRRRILAAADAVSSSTATYLEAVRGELEPGTATHVCYLGAYVEEFTPPPRRHPDEERGPVTVPEPLRCVYTGTLERSQDLDTLLAAARLLATGPALTELHVAGTGSLDHHLRSSAERIGGKTEVVVHGLLDRRAYARLLDSCDVGLVLVKPSSRVAVPYKAADYAAAGLAIVNGLPGELSDLIMEYEAGLDYVAGNAASLADAITRLALDREWMKRCRDGARAMASRRFDRERIYPAFARWIEELAS